MQDKAKEIEKHYKRTEDQIKKHEEMLKKEEHQMIVRDMERRMEKAREIARDYDAIGEDLEEKREMFDVAEIFVDNLLLIEQIDALIGKDPVEQSERTEEELSELS